MKMRISGEMIGVTAGMKFCETCGWAEVHLGPRTIQTENGVIIIQNGDVNYDCRNKADKDIDVGRENPKCSAWKPRE